MAVHTGCRAGQTAETFQAQGLGDIATSLAMEGYPVEQNHLAVCLLEELDIPKAMLPQVRSSSEIYGCADIQGVKVPSPRSAFSRAPSTWSRSHLTLVAEK